MTIIRNDDTNGLDAYTKFNSFIQLVSRNSLFETAFRIFYKDSICTASTAEQKNVLVTAESLTTQSGKSS